MSGQTSTVDRRAALEMRRIVHINEEIKHVVSSAFKINLMAMNAIFLAKRAGQNALGFGVLSNELRRFAMDLQHQMELLRETTYSSVATVTSLLKQARLSRIVDRALQASSGAGRRLIEGQMRQQRMDQVDRQQEQMAALNRKLSQMIYDTAQIVELGSVLARSAKIEAAYGGGFSSPLTQVSTDFEQIIGEIQRSLDKLNKTQEASR
ncbi:MAG TPA: chemotaxis protein [Rhodocyclaceae bacterium]